MTNILIELGKSWPNGTNESFNGKFRDECLAMNRFHRQKYAKFNRAVAETLQHDQATFKFGLSNAA
jgi:hypothetical protein